jgi:hypothetical protein
LGGCADMGQMLRVLRCYEQGVVGKGSVTEDDWEIGRGAILGRGVAKGFRKRR